MPNPANIRRPLLILGCGRTASTYVQQQLQDEQGSFQSVIENDVYRDVWSALTDRWWSDSMRFVAPEAEHRTRAVTATRQALLTMFPSMRGNWVMKMIWAKHDPDVVDDLFPDARYVHLVRDPRSNIASMMERLQFRQRHAETAYVEANQCAQRFDRFGDRYLRIRQEDFVLHRLETWERLARHAGIVVPGAGNWRREVNTSDSTKGEVRRLRADRQLRWNRLRRATREVAESLGYSEALHPATSKADASSKRTPERGAAAPG